ncbi:hypothetical protein GS416_11705 [Rhodococcus hoagii]|nr:hypothetical protein [Prescottella equi]
MVDPRGMGLADTSPWTITDARMDRYWDVMQEVCKTNNIVPQVNLYIHGEDEQPFPNHKKADPKHADRELRREGQRVAFTGTIIDGVIRTLLEAVDDTLARSPIRSSVRTVPGTSTCRKRPAPAWSAARPLRTGEYTNVSRVEQMTHIPLATRVTGGGKSRTG